MTKNKTWLPPDSWITLAPGESVTIDKELNLLWDKQKKTFREVRGNFLAECFQIEYQLDILICELFFPGLDDPKLLGTDKIPLTIGEAKILRSLFDQLVLKGGSMSQLSFAFKIDVFKKLIPDLSILKDIVPEGFIKKLNEARDIRNKFAHYPIQFRPKGTYPDQTLFAQLVTGDSTITLDNTFFEKYSKLFGYVLSNLRKIIEDLRKRTNNNISMA